MSLLRSPTKATPSDPNSSQHASGRHGNTGDSGKRGELGTIIDFQTDRYTATVRTERGRILQGVPCMRATPNEVSPLPRGTEVLVSHDYGPPIIIGCLNLPSTNNTGGIPFSISDIEGVGGTGANASNLSVGNYRGTSEPVDLIPGDWAEVGAEGNAFAILGGGTNVMRSGPLSQIRTHLINDKVEIISRNYRHVTDMGEFVIKNDNGHINMSFRGATDQLTEAGPDEEKWTIRMDLGSEGDLFNLEFTTPQGQTLFNLKVDGSGHAEMYAIDGINFSSGNRKGGTHSEDHEGNSARTVKGNRTSATSGNEIRNIKGNSEETISGNKHLAVDNDLSIQALRHITMGAGGTMKLAVLGGIIPGSDALEFDIENGSWFVDIGGPTAPFPHGINMKTFTGNIKHESTAGGSIDNETLIGTMTNRSLSHKISTFGIPDSVILGGENVTSHVVKWEELVAYLTALHVALDTHTHLIPGTATAAFIPVTGATAMPTIPIGSPISGMFPTFRSISTGVFI